MGKLERSIPERGLCDTDFNWREPDRTSNQLISVDDKVDPIFSGLFDARGEPLYAVRSRVGFLRFK
jgi:hypothetical protein